MAEKETADRLSVAKRPDPLTRFGIEMPKQPDVFVLNGRSDRDKDENWDDKRIYNQTKREAAELVIAAWVEEMQAAALVEAKAMQAPRVNGGLYDLFTQNQPTDAPPVDPSMTPAGQAISLVNDIYDGMEAAVAVAAEAWAEIQRRVPKKRDIPFEPSFPEFQHLHRELSKAAMASGGDVHRYIKSLQEPFKDFSNNDYPVKKLGLTPETKKQRNIRLNGEPVVARALTVAEMQTAARGARATRRANKRGGAS